MPCEYPASNVMIYKSFKKAKECLEAALYQAQLAYLEVRRHQHPIDGEIGGLMTNIIAKIKRLDDLTSEYEKG